MNQRQIDQEGSKLRTQNEEEGEAEFNRLGAEHSLVRELRHGVGVIGFRRVSGEKCLTLVQAYGFMYVGLHL